jgi:hypothetical protein
MLLLPLRRAPMMLGGVGFQVGLDEARRQSALRTASAAAVPDVVKQLKGLKELLDAGALSEEEFQLAKRKLLSG